MRERFDELKTYNSFAEFIADINEELQSEKTSSQFRKDIKRLDCNL